MLQQTRGFGEGSSNGTTSSGCGHGATISYDEALQKLHGIATLVTSESRPKYTSRKTPRKTGIGQDIRLPGAHYGRSVKRSVPIVEATGLRSACDVRAPHATPSFDSSAMDGFAVRSALTTNATKSSPVIFAVVGTSAAGTPPTIERGVLSALGGLPKCVEIMTGATFLDEEFPELDAVVKVEDVKLCKFSEVRHIFPVGVQDLSADTSCIQVSSPALANQHRRPSGSDFAPGDLVLREFDTVTPGHVMALASLGYGTVEVYFDGGRDTTRRKTSIKVGVLATGSELFQAANAASLEPLIPRMETSLATAWNAIPNSNGPYICSALVAANDNVQITDLGTVRDKRLLLQQRLVQTIEDGSHDVVITSGGVSMGRYDLVRSVVEDDLGGEVVFHGVKVRPGLPVLFAVIDRSKASKVYTMESKTGQHVAYFGLPGNPIAAAAALQFFVIPYLKMLEGDGILSGCNLNMPLRLDSTKKEDTQRLSWTRPQKKKPAHLTSFWLARRMTDQASKGEVVVEPLQDQASYKVKNLLMADCWVVISAGVQSVADRDLAQVTPIPGLY